ncbi:2-dehydropantoate 2-reductase [Variovorax paradoxus]|nr:2-dehydropantoate 2-reductase [Variovorax paradoxus]MBT2301931.1 2-dehydropantoate 2-reductase [Variovorax paradoxus]
MRICIFGAGAIGGFVAARLAQVPGLSVSVVARGEQLAAIRARGLRVVSPAGDLHARVEATDRAEDLGPQDAVFIALKQHQVAPALPALASLLGPETIVLPPTTGIPYWYFHGLSGPFEGRQLESLDPGGAQWRTLGPERAIGCVYWTPAEVLEPAVIHHDGKLLHFPIGEPDGSESPRIARFAQAMNAAGLNAPVVPDIRAWIWAKMISSLSWNPLAVLTEATLDVMTHDPDVVRLVRRLMGEAEEVAQAFGVSEWPITTDQRIEAARNSGAHRMSMLQDWDRGRPLEIDVLTDSIAAMRELAGVSTPTIDEVYALLRLRVTSACAAR